MTDPNPNVPTIPQTEPSRLVGAIIGVISAVFVFLVAINIPIDPSVQTAVIGLVTAVAVLIPILQAEITRNKVISPQSADNAIEAAYVAGQNGQAKPTRDQAINGVGTTP